MEVALIGPSRCGKSTFLRTLNRVNDLVEGTRHEGDVLRDDQEIYGSRIPAMERRRRVGMVFQKSNPFPKSVFENVVFGQHRAFVEEKEGRSRRRSSVSWTVCCASPAALSPVTSFSTLPLAKAPSCWNARSTCISNPCGASLAPPAT